MPDQNKTEIIVILDRSGSMQTIADDMRGGFNEFVAGQRKLPGECLVTLAQFDDRYEIVYETAPIANVPPLVLAPRGATALHDAIGRTVAAVGERLSNTPDDNRPGKIIVMIITDGQENASREYKRERVAEMIKHQRLVYNWEFLYLGANQDALEVAKGLGVDADSSLTYEANSGGTRAMLGAVHAQVTRTRGGGGRGTLNSDYQAAIKRGGN